MLFALLDELAAAGATRSLEHGSYLFRNGDPAAYLYTVRTGLVRLRRFTVDGRDVLMGRAGAGETLAEASLTSDHHHCDAIAVGATEVGMIAKHTVIDRLRRDPDFAFAIAAALAHQVRRDRARIEICSTRSARERVVQHLAQHCDATGLFRVATTLKDVASELGMTHEAFYRQLAALERDGVLGRERGGLRLRLDGR